MAITREQAIENLKAIFLKDAEPAEKPEIEAVFAVAGPVLTDLSRCADGLERIAKALEEANKPLISEAPKG